MNLAWLLEKRAKEKPDRIGLIFEDGAEFTYKDMNELSSQAGNLLKSLGVKKGDRVVSSGGLHGVVTGLTDEVVTMEIAPKVRVKVSRGSIAGIAGK